MATMINLYDFQFGNAVEIASTGLCLGLSIFMPIGLIITFYAIHKFRKLEIIGTEDYQERYSELTMDRDESERMTHFIKDYWKPMVLVRWTVTTLILCTIRNNP
jgi:hypothetical protein